MSPFKRLRAKRLLKGRIFQVQNETWRGPQRKVFERQVVIHPGAVAIASLDARGRLHLIRQYRPAVRQALLEIPAGTREKGERPLACAKRELIEETGFAAKRWKKLGAIFTAPGFCNERIIVYKAWDLKPAHGEQDEDEQIESAVMTSRQVKAAVRAGRIRDAKTLGTLLFLEWLK